MRESDAIGRRLHQCALRVWSKSKAVFFDGFFNWHVPSAKKLAGERVPPHEKQMENEDGEAKIVMVCCANDAVKLFVLQLWRRVLWHTDSAKKIASVRKNLKAIAVN